MPYKDPETKKKYGRIYNEKRREQIRVYNLAYRLRHGKKLSEYKRNHRLLKLYGISRAQFDAMIEAQAGLCAICTKPMRPDQTTHIDHCHRTGKIRSLLCVNCNHGIGCFSEDPAIISAALAYLEAHNV